jgi:hypothetical protein
VPRALEIRSRIRIWSTSMRCHGSGCGPLSEVLPVLSGVRCSRDRRHELCIIVVRLRTLQRMPGLLMIECAVHNAVSSVSEVTTFAHGLVTRVSLSTLPTNNSSCGVKRRGPPEAWLLLLLLGSVRRVLRFASPVQTSFSLTWNSRRYASTAFIQRCRRKSA